MWHCGSVASVRFVTVVKIRNAVARFSSLLMYDLLRTASPHEAWVLGVGHFELLPRCPSLRQDTDLEAAHQEQKPGRLCSANNMRSDQDQVS